MLPDTLANPPESVCHECRGSDNVCGGTEASNRQVALVLDGAVAALWRHILRHDGRLCSWFNWCWKGIVNAETSTEVPARDTAMTRAWLGALRCERA